MSIKLADPELFREQAFLGEHGSPPTTARFFR